MMRARPTSPAQHNHCHRHQPGTLLEHAFPPPVQLPHACASSRVHYPGLIIQHIMAEQAMQATQSALELTSSGWDGGSMLRSVMSRVAVRTYLGYLVALREQNILGLQIVVHLQQSACQANSKHQD